MAKIVRLTEGPISAVISIQPDQVHHELKSWERQSMKHFEKCHTFDGPNLSLFILAIINLSHLVGMNRPAIVSDSGLVLFGNDSVPVVVGVMRNSKGKMILAKNFGSHVQDNQSLDLTQQEEEICEKIAKIWESILRKDVDSETDFFLSGGGSMDVTRLIEEIREKLELSMENEDLYMSTTLEEFQKTVILKTRHQGASSLVFEQALIEANNLKIPCPVQLYINGRFVDSQEGKTLPTINPTDESVICNVQVATKKDVDIAVKAAHEALHNGQWSRLNARDRGVLLYRLADLMEKHKEELATLESADSGAVYTLALKTHVGMSIETFRYFAGWCDKIQGSTIPINNARPNRNLTLTKKEPIGVCGLITPWNYPLMMVSWKSAACLAAGNTLVLKPAQVSFAISAIICDSDYWCLAIQY